MATRRSWVTFVIGALVVGGCESSGIVAPHALRDLNAAETLWRSRPFEDYRYEIRTACFCPPEITQWVRVTVQGGAVVAAELVDPDPVYPITVTTLTYWQPIDSLFARLRQRLRDGSSWEFYAEISARYDDALGYPLEITYRAKPFIADGDSYHELRNVTPLPQALVTRGR